MEISAWCRKFCPLKILSNISIQKSGKNRTQLSNFGLVSKILSDEIFCPSKILSDESLSDKVFGIFFISDAQWQFISKDLLVGGVSG